MAAFAKKALANPYYCALWKATQDPNALLYAGFFDDGLEQPVHTYDWFKLLLPLSNYEPIQKRREQARLSGSKAKQVVLVCTGAFSPAHSGHLALMQQAKLHCESLGWDVLGGFLSPSHDLYVNQKAKGLARMDCAVRIQALNHLIAQDPATRDWISVHPWESLYAPCPLNFTDVLDRIENELVHYVCNDLSDRIQDKAPIELVYVFGADNRGFAHAFTSGLVPNRLGLCVGRAEPEKFTVNDLPDVNLSYPWQVPGAQDALRVSSSSIRAQFDWNPFKHPFTSELNTDSLVAKPLYIVRDDLVESLPLSLVGKVSVKALARFREGLMAAFHRALPGGLEVQCVPVLPCASSDWAELQRNSATLVLDKPLGALIAGKRLDWPGARLAQVSRVFELSATQAQPINMISDLDFVLGQLGGEGITHVLDDDRGSGRTQAWVLSEFERRGLKKPVFQFTLDAILPKDSSSVFDVVDARDFLLGFSAAGLVVELGPSSVKYARAPYWFPFVNLVTRAKMLPEKQKSFTSEVIALNQNFYREMLENSGVDCRVCDLDEACQDFLLYCGFEGTQSVMEVLSAFESALTLKPFMPCPPANI